MRPRKYLNSEAEKRLIRKLCFSPDYAEVPADAGCFMDVQRAKGLVQDNALVRRMRVLGLRENKDLVFPDE